VIVGTGFLGMKMASTLKEFNPDQDITIISREIVPLQNIFGREIGAAIKR